MSLASSFGLLILISALGIVTAAVAEYFTTPPTVKASETITEQPYSSPPTYLPSNPYPFRLPPPTKRSVVKPTKRSVVKPTKRSVVKPTCPHCSSIYFKAVTYSKNANGKMAKRYHCSGCQKLYHYGETGR